MNAAPIQPIATPYEWDRQRLSRRNSEAVLTMWTGLGAILSLLLTCFLGSLWRADTRTALSAAIMVVLLIISLILFFTASKRDDRWNVVCSLINHAGIGLAVLILLDVLGIDIRFRQLVMSGLPAAAILFGVIMIYVGMEGETRSRLLYGGAVVFGLAVLVAGYQFYTRRTEFWLCTAVCALLSCVNLCALIWTGGDPDRRSIYRTLAVVSFGVYILLAVAVAVAFALAILGNSDRDSSSGKKWSSKAKNRQSGFNRLFGGGSAASDSGLTSGSGAIRPVRTGSYLPRHIWYYSLYHGSSRNRSANDTAEDMPEYEREAMNRRIRRRRVIVFCAVLLTALLVIALAVYFGRG